jgi:alpha-mannosidase
MSEHTVRWTLQKAEVRYKLLQTLLYRRQMPLTGYAYMPLAGPQVAPPVQPGIDTSTWQPITPPTTFADWRTDFCIRTTFAIPSDWDTSQGPLVIYWLLNRPHSPAGPEALAYIDGEPVCGIDRFHHEIPLNPQLADGKPHNLALHGWTSFSEHSVEPIPEVQSAVLAQVEPAIRHFLALYRMALGTARSLPDNSPVRAGLLNALNAALARLDLQEPFGDRFYACVEDACQALESGIHAAGPAHPGDVAAAGHAHIDVAWLWTLGQTHRKTAHTFRNVLTLMKEFPDFLFSQSQPQLYDFIRRDDPALFSEIQQQVQTGRWEPMGGMWVEADCNLSGAESLVRQFLYGRQFFTEQFGVKTDSPVLWLPDVFGYCWSLPQLIKEAGLQYFFTIKIGWNQYNKLPWDSFWWQGIDGTRVLTHCSPTPDLGGYGASTYNAEAEPVQILGSRLQFKQPELTTAPVLMSFGYGDGGGGPTCEMLENIHLAANFPGLPATHFSRVSDFFAELEHSSADRLPTWDGELYFEYHRGTYTTQSKLKRANRKNEFLLHDTEFLWSWVKCLAPETEPPTHDLREAWHVVCLNQFHDVLPGSSIGPVYDEALAQHEQVRDDILPLRDQALSLLSERFGGELLLVNPTAFYRRDVTFIGAPASAKAYTDPEGRIILTQPTAEGFWIQPGADIPPYGVLPLRICDNAPLPDADLIRATTSLMENDCLRVELNPHGQITRIFDKHAQREVLPPNTYANLLQAFEDRPLYWDAWDLDIFYEDKPIPVIADGPARVVEQGFLTSALEVTFTLGSSRITQRIRLFRGSARIDFETTVDWHERHTVLKAAFPVDVLTPVATYDIQWGSVQRPTHRNTSWDWARFESCAHHWVDLSEGGYGVSLLNDCKYGHDVHGNTLRLTLLRAPTSPDPQADQGLQRFTYSLLPHCGGHEQAIPEGYLMNDPLIAWYSTATKQPDETPDYSMVKANQDNIVIETIKPAEDGRGIIVRLYDSARSRGSATLSFGFPIQSACLTNLLEEDRAPLPIDGQSVAITYRPFQIITLRVIPEA